MFVSPHLVVFCSLAQVTVSAESTIDRSSRVLPTNNWIMSLTVPTATVGLLAATTGLMPVDGPRTINNIHRYMTRPGSTRLYLRFCRGWWC